MIPLRDENLSHRIPFINYLLIALNVLVFLYEFSLGAAAEGFVYQFALIPVNVTNDLTLADAGTFLTSMFMHAGWAHIGGNMLYLWIFGDNIEDAMGHARYFLFYLIGGFAAAAAQIMINPDSQIPTVGASGAIGAVLGAYLVLYPRRRILTLLVLGYFIRLVMIPATFLLGFWIVMQVFSGLMVLGGPDVGGVAFWAHIGGFAVGAMLARLFAPRPPEPALY